MASEDLAKVTVNQIPKDASLDFAEQSHLTYLIPAASNINLENAFQHLKSGKSVFDVIDQRESLFFDETVDVLLILKTPWLEEEALRSQLGRLAISLEAQVVNGAATDKDLAPSSDTIFTGSIVDINDPFIVVDVEASDSGDDAHQHIYAVWKMSVYLARPRMRLQSPSVVLSGSASLKPDISAELSAGSDGYLQSGLPASLNLLQSFNGDPHLRGAVPRLSALRVSKVSPVTRRQDLVQHIRALQQLTLRIFPVVHSRIRFTRSNNLPPTAAVIALLEIDFTPHVDCEITLDKIQLSIPDGNVEDLNSEAQMALPLSCVSHDHITFLYRIAPHELTVTPKNPTRELQISITASAQVTPGVCTPQLKMAWSTTVDFTVPVNPGFGPATSTGIQRAHRPSQLSIGGGQAIVPMKSPSSLRPDALPTLEAATTQTEANVADLGITMSFTAPSHRVHPGDIFSWTIYIVNRSSEKSSRPPRKLALVAVTKRRRNDVRSTRPPSMSSRRRGEQDLAGAVLDENVLHAMQKNSIVDSTDVVCLSADTRVGPLAPGACYVAELQFLALQEGIVGIDAIRVVDLGSQEHVDIRDLPITIVEPIAS